MSQAKPRIFDDISNITNKIRVCTPNKLGVNKMRSVMMSRMPSENHRGTENDASPIKELADYMTAARG
jgi:hypothetical protein